LSVKEVCKVGSSSVDDRAEGTKGDNLAQNQLHHDNASPHKTRLIQIYLDQNGIHLIEHPPYSPNLAPCDFWLFPKIKSIIAGRSFSRIQDSDKAVHVAMKDIPV
jgi:histone-lysine N-methyltransferase SETMAR